MLWNMTVSIDTAYLQRKKNVSSKKYSLKWFVTWFVYSMWFKQFTNKGKLKSWTYVVFSMKGERCSYGHLVINSCVAFNLFISLNEIAQIFLNLCGNTVHILYEITQFSYMMMHKKLKIAVHVWVFSSLKLSCFISLNCVNCNYTAILLILISVTASTLRKSKLDLINWQMSVEWFATKKRHFTLETKRLLRSTLKIFPRLIVWILASQN